MNGKITFFGMLICRGVSFGGKEAFEIPGFEESVQTRKGP